MLEKLVLPIQEEKVIISQGFNGPYSHKIYTNKFGKTHDDSFSLDFAQDINSPVFAAKNGKLRGFLDCSSNYYTGLDEKKGFDIWPNVLILEHDNGIFSMYSHLKKDSVLPRNGDFVKEGDLIAYTGLSGWIGKIPHLHFSLYYLGKNRERKTIPFKFKNYSKNLEHSKL